MVCCTCIFLKQFQWSGHLFPGLSACAVNCNNQSGGCVLINAVRPQPQHWLTFREAVRENIMNAVKRHRFTYCDLTTQAIRTPLLNTFVVCCLPRNAALGRQAQKSEGGDKKETSGYHRETLKRKVKLQFQYFLFLSVCFPNKGVRLYHCRQFSWTIVLNFTRH